MIIYPESRLRNHLDEDILTIMYYDEPFLEVQNRKTGVCGLVEIDEHIPIVDFGDEPCRILSRIALGGNVTCTLL